jgi:selenide,water dikinase
LAQLLAQLPPQFRPELLVGFDTSDDAAVWRLTSELALISTVDFFPPMVEDGRLFGQIAATNALSDIYAMGGQPLLALSLVNFPQDLDPAILGEILAGAAETVQRAGACLAGGHSIYDPLPKFGLAVTGLAHPERIRRNNTLEIGDALILTKPLGVGLILSAYRAKVALEEDFARAVASMTRLNDQAARVMSQFPTRAATDVSGFGLLGHLAEMAGQDFAIGLDFASIPILPGASRYATEFLTSALAQRNRNFLAPRVDLSSLSGAQEEILFDPQTSGGLLISLPPNRAQELVAALQAQNPGAAIIGQVFPRRPQEPTIFVL